MSCVFLHYCAALSGSRLPHLFFGLLLGLLCCLCLSKVLCVSTPPPGFSFGCDGVSSLFVGLLRLLRFQLLLRLCFVFAAAPPFVCSGSYYPLSFSASRIPGCSFQSSSTFFRGLMLRLLLPVLLLVFTHATAPAAPPVLPLHFHGLRLWLLLALCGAAPVALLVADFPGVVPHHSCFELPGASPLSLCLDFPRFLPFFITLVSRAACSPSMSLPPRPCWRFSSLRLRCLLSRCNFPLFECPYCILL